MITSVPALGGAVVKARSEAHGEEGVDLNSTADINPAGRTALLIEPKELALLL